VRAPVNISQLYISHTLFIFLLDFELLESIISQLSLKII